MKPDFDFNCVPNGFIHCFNDKCKYAEKCLRHQVALRIPDTCAVYTVINPAYKFPDDKECHYFKADQLKRFALGMSHIFDNISYHDAVIIRRQMKSYFEHSTYYRCMRRERLVTPAEQAYIQKLFLSYGIKEEPVYDEYLEKYEW